MLNKIQELKSKLAAMEPREGQILITGETTELGEKYYGPLLSNYMIDMLQREKDRTPLSEPGSESVSAPVSEHTESRDPSVETSEGEGDGDDLGQVKKKLPHLLAPGASAEDNLGVLVFLVNHFFSLTKYANFISRPLMLNFVRNNNLIKEDEWENDDDLLLLHMMLILLVLRLTPRDYYKSGLSSAPLESMDELNCVINRLIKKILFPEFIRLRHNLINESVVTVQAHILCIEWHVIEKLYEEAWSMMFHSCSIAYSIGLHVMFNLRTASKVTDKTARQILEMTEGQEISKEGDGEGSHGDTSNPTDEDDDNEDYRMARFKVWFALKHISGQLCSMLGRPSPILIQVNLLVLLSVRSGGLSKMGLELKETQAHLKMGISECIRLSNLMLIESFMINFTLGDIMQLEVRFQEESKVLAWFASAEYQSSIKGKEGEMNQYSDIPIHIGKREALADLVALHVNRAKLLQPFMNQFIGGADNGYLFTAICGSIREFLKCATSFVKTFLQHHVPKFVNSDDKVIGDIDLHKSLKIHHPFVETFIYQGMIVTFTLLSYKATELLREAFIEFVKETKNSLIDLIALDLQCQELLGQGVRFWPKSIVFLANKNIQYADKIYKRYEEYLENQSANSDAIFGSDITESNSVLGFNMDDPFWITNPKNLPYYLNNPSDDDMRQQQSYEGNKFVQGGDLYQTPLLMVTPEQNITPQQSQPTQPPSEFASDPVLLTKQFPHLQQPLPVHSSDLNQPSAQGSANESSLSYSSMGFQSVPPAISALSSLDHIASDKTYKVGSISTSLDLLLTHTMEQN